MKHKCVYAHKLTYLVHSDWKIATAYTCEMLAATPKSTQCNHPKMELILNMIQKYLKKNNDFFVYFMHSAITNLPSLMIL
jgi:ERCC4-related helicase